MAKIAVGVDCGNSPKKEFLKNYYIALANGDIDFVMDNISDIINWEVIGSRTIKNKEEFKSTNFGMLKNLKLTQL
jgi:ketosteroid isomerase-like protein